MRLCQDCSATEAIDSVLHNSQKMYPNFSILTHPQASQRGCFDVYVVTSRNRSKPEVIVSNQIIPSVSDDGKLTLNVTTNSTLSTNTLYRATLFTAMDMMEAGNIQFCKYTLATAW